MLRNLYITADEAQTRLLASGICSLETLPALEILNYSLTAIQLDMDGWLRQSLLPSLYQDTIFTNYLGVGIIPRSPVQEVRSVDAIVLAIGQPRQMNRVTASWDGTRELAGLGAKQKYEVSYVAGFDPVPQIAAQVAFNLLKKVMVQGMDLNERTRYLTNVNLQGGMGQTFQIGAEPKGSPSSRNLDDLMLPLQQYRKKIWT